MCTTYFLIFMIFALYSFTAFGITLLGYLLFLVFSITHSSSNSLEDKGGSGGELILSDFPKIDLPPGSSLEELLMDRDPRETPVLESQI